MLEMLTKVVEEAHQWGIPVVCHAYPSGELWGDRKGSTESVLYASRAAAELGTDIVKTWYTGSADEFRTVVEGTPAIVVAAGGAPVVQPARRPRAGRRRHRGRRARHDRRPQRVGRAGPGQDGPRPQGRHPRRRQPGRRGEAPHRLNGVGRAAPTREGSRR